jgi:hypothetical protein
MSDVSDPDPLSGLIDDKPDETPAPTSAPEKVEHDDGSEWIPEPRPAEGDGPLP